MRGRERNHLPVARQKAEGASIGQDPGALVGGADEGHPAVQQALRPGLLLDRISQLVLGG
ncbi:hypothetical protein BO94DRAFT_318052 [Aspergillus sclerotioniger CBS 115572]|uniref:Uncharacterized protein n=1 Tax=Aspergillus sclerotioniger CBS 115572 TaxID=1450535 RepID=A0A317X612_9EURO|nr:hypothetical protein BO94DRAFT_318052 [Aspergillus sclerotioniger CBS 115572]PWY94056.1 hypothetical protein BO94DRAFT_318052 [Aspergillus sclerotioniger CBS 115572]